MQLRRMEEIIEIVHLESCLLIYSYLMVFGKTTPANLREVTGQSKATIFRNLAKLYDAGILNKEEVKSVDDKRYSLHYYISKSIMDITKKLYSKKIANYAISTGKEKLIDEWMFCVESLPYLLHQQASYFLLQKAQQSVTDDGLTTVAVSKFHIFRIQDISDVGDIHRKLGSVVESIDELQSTGKRDWKEPLPNPVAISISVVSLNPQGLSSDSDAIIKRVKL